VRAAANGGPGSRVRRPSQGGMRIRAGVAPAAARLESSRYSPIVTSLARLAIRSPHLSPIVTSGSGRLRGFCDSETWIDRGTHVIAGNTCKSPTFAMSSVSRGSARVWDSACASESQSAEAAGQRLRVQQEARGAPAQTIALSRSRAVRLSGPGRRPRLSRNWHRWFGVRIRRITSETAASWSRSGAGWKRVDRDAGRGPWPVCVVECASGASPSRSSHG
jgi:hypothetical protein